MVAPALPEDVLERNLRALASVAPGLARRLCEPVADDHVLLSRSGSGLPTAKLCHPAEIWLHSRHDPQAEADQIAAKWSCDGHDAVLLLGVGLGYELKSLRHHLPPHRPILAYERDPWLLRLALYCNDFSRDLLSQRLSFILGTDLETVLNDYRERGMSVQVFHHPVLGRLYRPERTLVSLPRTDGERERVLVAAGGLFVDDAWDTFVHAGFKVLLWDPLRVSREETVRQIKAFSPRLVFSINFIQGLPQVCEQLGIHYVAWEIDPTIERIPKLDHDFPRTRIYTYRKAHLHRYRQAGFRHVEYLPLAANCRRRFPLQLSTEERRRYGADVAFVGDSMVGQSRELFDLFRSVCRANGISVADRIWDDLVTAQELDPERDVAAEIWRRWSQGRAGRRNFATPDGRLVDLVDCLAERGASRYRVARVKCLGADVDLAIWGDEAWRNVLPPGMYRGRAGHHRELTRIYNGARINLDINRLYQRDIVTMRVFDVMACGGFVLADSDGDIHELFRVGEEVVAYGSSAQLRDRVDYFLSNERERRQIAAAGYQRVLADHTMDCRIRNILEDI